MITVRLPNNALLCLEKTNLFLPVVLVEDHRMFLYKDEVWEKIGREDMGNLSNLNDATHVGLDEKVELLSMTPHSKYDGGLPPSDWVPLADVLQIIRSTQQNGGRWTWARNAHCKYLDIRLDTRDGRCLLRNRDGKSITLDDLKRQYPL